MQTLESHKVISVDVDDTLILWDLSAYPDMPRIEVDYAGYKSTLIPHQKNINLLIKLAKLGYEIVVWSATGYDWAELIVAELNLGEYVTLCMSKPRYYVDDKNAESWIGERLWREVK